MKDKPEPKNKKMKIFELANSVILSSCKAVKKIHELILQTVYGSKQFIATAAS